MSDINISVDGGTSKRLLTAGKYCESDIVVTASGGGGDDDTLKGIIERTATSVNIPVGTGMIAANVFSNYYDLASVTVPSGVKKIGNAAFNNCKGLTSITLPSDLEELGENAFYSCAKIASIELPSGLKIIGPSAFQYCTTLALTELPSEVISLGSYAFANCTALALTSIPSGLKNLGNNYTFRSCTGLTEITFKGTPTYMSGSVFNGCTNLLTINVPWSEGAVANAPWGATNATINYNYTGA